MRWAQEPGIRDMLIGDARLAAEHVHEWERCVTCEDGSLVCVKHPVPFPHQDAETEDATPERIAHSFAIKYGLREHLTYEQAMALETDLTTHLRTWAHR